MPREVSSPLFDPPATSAVPDPVRGLRLQKLSLRNFKGIREFTLDACGRNVDIFGDNSTGKTTLFDAFTWLLFDKDSANRKDFEIKTIGPDGPAVHGLEHEVEGTFEIAGRQVTLRKVYSEQWTKRRGSAEKQFTGHTTDYFVDGVPVQRKEYEARISWMVDERAFRLLSDPSYFGEQLHWQERRKLLLEVCGDCPDSEVIASNPKLLELRSILGGRSLEDHRKVIAATRSKINKELEQIPVRISEVMRSQPDVHGLNPKQAADELEQARAKRQQLLERLALIENGGQIADKQRRLAEAETRTLQIENEHRRQADQAYSLKLRKLQDAKASVETAERELRRIATDTQDATERSAQLAARLEDLRLQYRAVAAEELEYAAETACPTCGQPLPEDQVEAARAKALEHHNVSKAERLEKINAEGRRLKNEVGLLEAGLKRLAGERATAEQRLREIQSAVDDARADIDATGPTAPSAAASEDPEYRCLSAEAEIIQAEVAELRQGAQLQTADLRAELAAVERAVAACERVLSQVEQYQLGVQRVTELQTDEKRLAAEFERLERELHLTEEFVRVKIRLLEDRINSRFKHARFKLFDVQVNGGLVECCETTYSGVPYSTALNRGARLNIGLDIINTLTEHFRFSAPIVVDNAEAVTKLIPVTGQLIRLVVSAADKSLRVEVA